MDFNLFRATYPAREPDASKIRNQDEMVLLSAEEGRLSMMSKVCANDVMFGEAPRVYGDRGPVYLWVIGTADVPYALEAAERGKSLATGVLKHTNLTGGLPAHCGGELWFLNENQIVISGSSGRYGPQSDEELNDAALAFKAGGYQIASLGFDEDTGTPNTVLVGQLEWL